MNISFNSIFPQAALHFCDVEHDFLIQSIAWNQLLRIRASDAQLGMRSGPDSGIELETGLTERHPGAGLNTPPVTSRSGRISCALRPTWLERLPRFQLASSSFSRIENLRPCGAGSSHFRMVLLIAVGAVVINRVYLKRLFGVRAIQFAVAGSGCNHLGHTGFDRWQDFSRHK